MASRAARKSKSAKPARAGKKAPAKKKASPPARTRRQAPARKRPSAVRAEIDVAVAGSRYHTVTPFLNVKGAERAIDYYKQAFGAEERLRMPGPNGSIMHAELVIGDSTIMLSDALFQPETRSSLHVYVDDCDSLFERAVSAGGTVKMAPQDMFWGDRYSQLEDPFGNVWSIATHKEDVPADEMARRAAEAAEQFVPPTSGDSGLS
jgi:PhnB protein